jgi:alkanesulfonate monooxygenase SsuD/methylene tetrahydromethanopterin reductase-like flavin-dependent oxidoreductase (luciferase family)
MPVEFGLSLLEGPPTGQNNQWLADLDASVPHLKGLFRSLWMTDHFFWEGRPTFEAWTAMSFIISRYSDFEVGPMVLGQNYRNPAMLALMASTLQALSKGRFVMGIGAGWKEDEYHAYNYDYPSPKIRLEQLEDTLIIFKKMWEEVGQVSYEGKHYSIKDAWCEPKSEVSIPILVGGGGKTTMKHAAKYADMWNLPDAPIGRYTERLNILKNHLNDMEREQDTIRFSWFGRVAIGKTEAEAQERGNSRAMKWTKDNAFVGTPEQIAEQMSLFVEQGCDYFMIDIIGLPDEDVIGLVTEDLLPKVKNL